MTKGVLLDVAGVLMDQGRVVPGSVEAIARLRDSGLPLRFVTNSTRKPRRALLEQLAGMGFDIAPDEVFTPAIAARDLLLARDRAAHLLIHPDLREDFSGMLGGDRPSTVIVGDAAQYFTYEALNAAFRELVDGADMIALAMNRSFNDSDGQLSLDTGAFVTALEFASGVTAEVVGKPSTAFFDAALESMQVHRNDAVMIGDDAESDVAGAFKAGLAQAILVRTGKYRPGAEDAHDPAPSAVVADLSAAVATILGER